MKLEAKNIWAHVEKNQQKKTALQLMWFDLSTFTGQDQSKPMLEISLIVFMESLAAWAKAQRRTRRMLTNVMSLVPALKFSSLASLLPLLLLLFLEVGLCGREEYHFFNKL